MSTEQAARRRVWGLSLLFAAVYMVSYITRINYGAVISEMERTTGFSRSALSMALTGSFITYGVGQVISGLLGDRFSPKRLLSLGLVATVAMNLLIPLCQSPVQMCVVWSLNGLAQSFMWPPMVRLMSAMLTTEEYAKTSTVVSFGSSVGTIAVYGAAPLFISLFQWRAMFRFSAACGAVMLIVWNLCLKEPDLSRPAVPASTPTAPAAHRGSVVSLTLIGIMVAVVLQGLLRDGVTTWMPSYIAETYSLGSATSILTGVVLPLFSILCLQLASTLYRRRLTNPVLCAAVFFAGGAVAAAILYSLSGQNAVFSVLASAVLTGCMHGVNLMLICMVPAFYARRGHASTISGVINACTYVGSSISSYGIARLSETIGWQNTLLVWLGVAVAGTLLCVLCVRPWHRLTSADSAQ